MLRSILAASTLRALLAWNASSAVPVRFRCDGSALLGLWTFDGKAAAVRRAGILETWWSPGCTCWLSATPLAGVEDVVVTGGPSTYFGTAYRGLVGLGLVRRRYPGRRWYGILGDDNYVHWPSLFAGLRRLDGRARAGAFPLPVAAGEVGDEAGARRFFGGAGVFTNAEMTDALAPHLEGLAASVVARANASNFEKRSLLHDVLVSSFLRETLQLPPAVARTGPRSGPDLLTHADFLYSSEPAFYICARARLARTWLKHAPAIFHKFRSRRHLRRVHVVATTGAPSDEARAADAEGVMVLLRAGANLEARNQKADTPLRIAIFEGHREVALTLLRAGAAVTVLRAAWIKPKNKALHDYMVDLIHDGGWNARVERHRRPLMSILSNLALPHDARVVVLSFWSPPGGR
ncbi:hypothetical protein JL721_823 [Aureococcus anophagefferens]|nr:hypothetical protein JL721_823 [Aureococcus anophagefferens]